MSQCEHACLTLESMERNNINGPETIIETVTKTRNQTMVTEVLFFFFSVMNVRSYNRDIKLHATTPSRTIAAFGKIGSNTDKPVPLYGENSDDSTQTFPYLR